MNEIESVQHVLAGGAYARVQTAPAAELLSLPVGGPVAADE